MFKRILQGSADQSPLRTTSGETANSTLPNSEWNRTELPRKASPARLPSIDEIYGKSTFKTGPGAEYHILKVADMLNSEHLDGLSPTAKHNAVMMALEAAGIAVEDILQDAVQRQRVLNEFEESQRRRLEEFERTKVRENERLAAEMDAICAQYRARIGAGVEEIERERDVFHEWQDRKAREQRRIADAASACVAEENPGSSDSSVTRLLEKNASRFRESA